MEVLLENSTRPTARTQLQRYEQLSSPKDEPTLDRSVTKYFQNIRRSTSREDFTQNNQRMKQIVKEAIKHLPKFFNPDPTDYMNQQTLTEAGRASSSLKISLKQ